MDYNSRFGNYMSGVGLYIVNGFLCRESRGVQDQRLRRMLSYCKDIISLKTEINCLEHMFEHNYYMQGVSYNFARKIQWYS